MQQDSSVCQPQPQGGKATLQSVPVQQAIGMILCHDMTKIVPGVTKGPRFRKGHVIREEDVDELLSMGKEHLYVLEPVPGMVHEEEAALRLSQAAGGTGVTLSEVKEGRVNFHAAYDGLLQIDVQALLEINSLGEIAFATMPHMQPVSQGQALAGVRVIPLLVDEGKVIAAEKICSTLDPKAGIVSILPFRSLRVGMVVTGSEIFHGRIEDAFGPVVQKKFDVWGSEVVGKAYTSDDVSLTSEAILDFARGPLQVDMIVVTGGMSVDPDDKTPAAIRNTGADIEFYGSPTFPGAMFMLAYLSTDRGTIPVMGLPGCVMYHKASIFDVVAARLLAGLRVRRNDIVQLGHGGFCASCPVCHYPVCTFCKD